MGRNRFIEPGTKRIDISDGDWIEVKKELNSGDQKKLEAAGTGRPMLVEGRVLNPIDWSNYEFERDMVWLVDWSFTRDEDGKQVAVRLDMSAVRALDPETWDEIDKAIQLHAVEVAQAKKSRAAERMGKVSLSTPTPPSEPATEGAPTSQS